MAFKAVAGEMPSDVNCTGSTLGMWHHFQSPLRVVYTTQTHTTHTLHRHRHRHTHLPYYAHNYHRGSTTLTDQRRTTPLSGWSL